MTVCRQVASESTKKVRIEYAELKIYEERKPPTPMERPTPSREKKN